MAASKSLTPAQRSMRARMAARKSWANTEDRSARTEAARRAALDRFEREVDPDGRLDPDERARRADQARKSYFTGLALRSSQARSRATEPGPAPEPPARPRRRVVRRPGGWRR